MANPALAPTDGTTIQNEVTVRAKYTVGGSGVLTVVKAPWITSVTRNSAGSYTFLFPGSFAGGLYDFNATLIGAYTTAGGTMAQVTVDSSATAATRTVTVVFYAVGTQTATEVDSGLTVIFSFKFKNGIV